MSRSFFGDGPGLRYNTGTMAKDKLVQAAGLESLIYTISGQRVMP